MKEVKVFAIKVIKDGYEQVIYVTADKVKSSHLCLFDELDESEQELFGNTELGNSFAVFEPDSLD